VPTTARRLRAGTVQTVSRWLHRTRLFAASHLGKVTDVSDGTAAILPRYEFDAWGRRTLTSGTDVTTVVSLGISGKLRLRCGRRGIAPTTLIWAAGLAKTRLSSSMGRTLCYVWNSPVRLFDPDGRQAQA
jgi:hypothetical protein